MVLGRPGAGLHPSVELVLHDGPGGLVATFNRAGVLAPSDVHVARALARLGGESDASVVLAAALAVRAPRAGHVLAELSTLRGTVTSEAPTMMADGEGQAEADLTCLPWPELTAWLQALARSSLVACGPSGGDDRPLRLIGSALYLDRYWRDERAVATDLQARHRALPPAIDETAMMSGLARLFPEGGARAQRQAAANALVRRFSVIAGGPGTGKTTTVARLLALIEEQAVTAGGALPLVALAAPTGKAAARMAEAVHDEAGRLEVGEGTRQRLRALEASTVHRLLGRHPASSSRSRHGGGNQLPHDVVVIDEASMMSLPLMARLLEAVRHDARLVLVGDHEQLASVEAGAVFGDIVGPAGGGTPPAPAAASSASSLGPAITVLDANYRFTGPLAQLAEAIHAGDGDGVMAVLSPRQGASGEGDGLQWLPFDAATAGAESLGPVRSVLLGAGRALAGAAAQGDGEAALEALGRVRLLCAHRAGPAGVSTWNSRAEQWLAADAADAPNAGPPGPVPSEGAMAVPGHGGWYLGRPVVVTENDYGLDLFNGDTGVVVARAAGGLAVAFRRAGAVVTVSPARLAAVQTAFAMTAHRAQGSEFDQVVVLLPSPTSRVLTRELLFTAVTRARRKLVLVGTEESVRAALRRPIARASGLTAALWA
ncbi:MAG: exodeoxyribonuclease V subunit alpha [Acidimicrobiales bacterium]